MDVLVVEDDPNLAFLWGEVLENAGHDVRIVDTETAAVTSLQKTPHDLVILDLCLHGKKALGVATLATYRNPLCKVVIVSGSAEYSRRTLFAMSPAVAATLRKPVDIEDLVQVCEAVGRNERHVPLPVLEASGVAFRQ
ncbi:response regulator [Tropicimonas sp. TH_r6]|uniref:response regulator n=1 Tax=Tropicimonas sp. TH_r6 TaxID=3082085 RepID=UPI002954E880|nr:response regulator [Tropicimonas sp. TH_r6]MDV7145043.1 response regulator [Tropicimonas sp. TH_r6]